VAVYKSLYDIMVMTSFMTVFLTLNDTVLWTFEIYPFDVDIGTFTLQAIFIFSE